MERQDRPRRVVLVDIDGTVADVSHRLHHVQGRPRNWKRFFEGMDRDEPITRVIEHVRKLARDHDVVLFTGRPEPYRARTEAWLRAHNVPYTRLLMRPAGDRRPDYVTKREMLRHVDHQRIALAIDDRDPVCEMLRNEGIRVLEVHSDLENQAVNDVYAESPEAPAAP
ncbi:MAG: hypothetical protein AB2A00_30485 [Myxococcota bacterium]